MVKLAIKILIILVIILSTTMIRGGNCEHLTDLKWMLGNWEARSETTIVREAWRQVSKQTFEGTGQSLDTKTGKVKFSESMRIVSMSGKIYYLAKVDENTFPIAFELTMCKKQLALFENPDHDFPKKLGFYMNNEDLVVDVLGDEDKGYTITYSATFADNQSR